MDLSNEVFEAYAQKRINQKELYDKVGAQEQGFDECLYKEVLSACNAKDFERIEYLVFALFFCEDVLQLYRFAEVLNDLLDSDWHKQHEDIVTLLQKAKCESSVDSLYRLIIKRPTYLEWDENHALEIKCTRTLKSIGSEKAIERLKMLTSSDVDKIRICAEKQLEKMME